MKLGLNLEALGGWTSFFEKELSKKYFKSLVGFIEEQFELKKSVFPPRELIFNSFVQTQPQSVKVVIVGQDPYHGLGQAHGVSFSVCPGVKPPPSLKNIFKELASDLKIKQPNHGCLLSWAHQGVLLLNATLTVNEGEPKSHYGQGWELFTDHVIEYLAKLDQPIVFLLWGKSAQEKCLHLLNEDVNEKHLVLQTTHPSPFAAHRGFLGSRHFSKTNNFLKNLGVAPIDWSLD